MIPKTVVVVGKDGSARFDGQEKSDQCFKISELAKGAGKVVDDKQKDHQPVYQDINRTSR